MSSSDFFVLLSLALMKAGVPNNRITAFLRELNGTIILNQFTLLEASELVKKYSPNFPELQQSDWDNAQQAVGNNRLLGINIIGIKGDNYPKFLSAIKDAPPLLFVRGNLELIHELPGIAIVGARKASQNGLEIARRLATFCASNNWVVVSGLALGIDAAAHKGTLESGGKTIAVLASGLDKPTPRENAVLAGQILETGGAWVSEHSIGVPAKKHHFVPRNRIQIGLSVGSIIVEAALRSGSITQAKFCVGNNRSLFAVVPEDDKNRLKLNSVGTLEMVKDLGAIPIASKSDYTNMLALMSDKRDLLTDSIF